MTEKLQHYAENIRTKIPMTDKEIGKTAREIAERGNTAEVKPATDGEVVIVEKRGNIVLRGFPEEKGQ